MKWIYSIALLLTLIITGLFIYIESLELKDIGNSALALFSTFLGATLAFRLDEEKTKREKSQKQREALNRALFILLRKYNALFQIARDFDKFPEEFNAAFNMPAWNPPRYEDLTHNFTDLEFLIEASEPNTLLKLTVEQERFHAAIDSVRLRNEFYVGEVQKALAALEMNRKSFTPKEAEALLGDRIYGGAVNSVNNAKQHVYASCQSLTEMTEEVRAVAKKLFPGHKFIAYEVPHEPAA